MTGLDSGDFNLDTFEACVAPVTGTAFLVLDRDERVRFLNRGAALLLGVTSADDPGRSWTDVCPPAEPGSLDLRRLAAHGTEGIRTALRLADGTRVPIVAAAQVIGDVVIVRMEREAGATVPDLGSLLASATRDAVICTDADGIVTYWNEGAARLYGWTAEERIGRPVTDRYPEAERPDLEATVAAIREGREWDGEFENWHKDGRRIWVDARVRAMRAPDGRVTGLLGISHDISARKAAERAMRESEERLRLALEAADAGVWEWDIATGRATWSRQTYLLYGLAPDTPASIGAWVACIDPEDRDAASAAVADALAGRVPEFRAEYRVKHPDGTTHWLLGIGKLARAPDGTPRRMFGIHVDVTERREQMRVLEETEQRLSAAQAAARLGSWTWDPQKGSAWWSEATYELFGIDRSVPPSFDTFLSLLHPDDRPRAVARLEAVLQGADRIRDDFRLVRPDGSVLWIDSRGHAVRDASGGLVRVVGTDQDITDRKRAERALSWNNRVLELIADGAPLAATLAEIVALVEEQLPGAICAIFTLEDGPRLHVAAAPHMPPDMIAAIEGSAPGPLDGATWAAAHSAQPVIVEDVETHPSWANYRDLAHAHGIRSCLAVPIIASGNVSGLTRGRVLGTFSVYRRVPGAPDPLALASLSSDVPRDDEGRQPEPPVAGAAHLARVAIERHRAEEALRASEARFRSVLDASPALVYLKDLDGRYLFVNRQSVEATGIPADAWLGRTAADVLPADVAAEFARQDRIVLDTAAAQQFEADVAFADRQRRTLLTIQFPLLRADGQAYAVCGMATDITDRKRAQEERDRLWNLSPDPLCVAGLDGDLRQVNPAWSERLGWSTEEILASRWQDLVHPDDVAGTRKAFEALSRGGSVRAFENRYRTKGGGWRWFSWNAVPLPDRQAMHGFVRDVTEERQLRDQLQQAQKIEAIGQLAGGIAHDFNNLLTVINGFTALLLGSAALRDDQREPLQAIHDAGERAAALTAQLLAFSRKALVEPRVLDLNAAAQGSARMLSRLIGEDIHLETVLAPGLPRVRIDPGQLEQVLMNLVVNARDAMPRGGLLRITTSDVLMPAGTGVDAALLPGGRYVRLTVADSGIGMSDDVKSRIFEPFFTTKGVGKGTGLGLATVYGIVRQAGGTVTVDSEPGRGAAFHVLLPALAQVPGDEPARPADATPIGSECLLLVEDEAAVRRLTRMALEVQGYRVLEASSADEAVALVEAYGERIHLLITDVVMPGRGGRQLADDLRRRRPDMHVLFMSGYTDDALVRHGVETARDAFLQKPFTPLSLARKVREVLDRPYSRA